MWVNVHHTLYEMLQPKSHPLKLCKVTAIPDIHSQTKYWACFEIWGSPLLVKLNHGTTFEKLLVLNGDPRLFWNGSALLQSDTLEKHIVSIKH